MLELQGIEGGYGGTTVLRDVSLSIPPGSVVALLGPNVAGKSTTMRMASGLLRPRSGRVLGPEVELHLLGGREEPVGGLGLDHEAPSGDSGGLGGFHPVPEPATGPLPSS